MRFLPLFLALAGTLPAQYRLYTCMVTSKNYVVGARLPASGIFVRPAAGGWKQIGFNHPYIAAVDYDPRDPSVVFIAAGNGLIRATNGGAQHWKILTGNDVTELRDLAVDRNAPGTIYFAHTSGIRVTHDGGATWQAADTGLKRKNTESIRVDRRRAGRLVAGTEEGLFVSENGGGSWKLAGAAGFGVMHTEQSPHDPCFWLAVTEQGGIFESRDCAASFESLGNIGVNRNLYDISFDATRPGRVAVAGWGPGVVVSEDHGKTWQARNGGLPSTDIWSIAFDPDKPGRLYASVHEEAVFVSEDAGRTWKREALEGSLVYRMTFVPEAAK